MKKTVKLMSFLALIALMIFTSCEKDDPKILVESISVTPNTLEKIEGDTPLKITATVLPKNATNKKVEWTSSNEKVATVTDGMITFKSVGKATIIVSAVDKSGKTAKCKVTVKAKVISVTGITLDKTELTKEEGETEQLTATITPANATNKTLTWVSGDEQIATVDANGKVTALKEGKTTIIAVTKDENKTAKCKLTVKKQPYIELTTTKVIGETIKLAIKVDEQNRAGIWIDLNNNGVKDNNERDIQFYSYNNATKEDYKAYTLGSQTIRIYGKVKEFGTYNEWNSEQKKEIGQHITKLDISNHTALKGLSCNVNKLSNLDISKNTELEKLDCRDNQLTSLDVSKNTKLKELSCDRNKISNLDISKNTELEGLDCRDNQLTSLDVSQNSSLIKLYCSANELTSLDVSKNTELTELDCGVNSLTTLDISKNINLTYLRCVSMYDKAGKKCLTSLDVSQNILLTYLDCRSIGITSLDVSQIKNLKTFYTIGNENLTCIKVSAYQLANNGIQDGSWSCYRGTLSTTCN